MRKNSRSRAAWAAASALSFSALSAAFAGPGAPVALAAPPPGSVVRYGMIAEPPSLNTIKTSDSESQFITGHVLEGLMRYTGKDDGSVEPGVAERQELKGLTYTFHLRKNARWSDGQPVAAKDFVFAWRKAVDPKSGAEFANFLFPIKNAERIAKSELKPEELGARAADDQTLVVELERPCGWFLQLTALPVYKPVREDIYLSRGAKFAADAGDLVYNGPFMVTAWTHGASLTLERNPHYWDPSLPKVAKLEIPYITKDRGTLFNLFHAGKIDLMSPLDRDNLPRAQELGYKVRSFNKWVTYFWMLNFRDGHELTRSKEFRRALAILLEAHSSELVSRIVGLPGTTRATSILPSTMQGTSRAFLKEYPPRKPARDLAEARRLIEGLRKARGGKLPPLKFLSSDSPSQSRQALFLQEILKKDLGLELQIDQQIWTMQLAKLSSGEFDIGVFGWSPDYPDPLNFFEILSSANENNRGRWSSPEYDRLIAEASKAPTRKARMDLLGQAQKLLEEEMPIVPTYEYVETWLLQPQVSGVIRRVFGPDPDFTRATRSK